MRWNPPAFVARLLLVVAAGIAYSPEGLATCYCPNGYEVHQETISDGNDGSYSSETCVQNFNVVSCAFNSLAGSKSATATSTGTSVSSAIATSSTTAITAITDKATTVNLSQSATVQAAGDVSLIAANNQANAGLLMCAQSGNKAIEGDSSSAGDIAACQSYFKKTDELVKMAQKGGVGGALHPDEGMLSDPAAVSTLDKFQSNFGIDKDEYVRRMLTSHGQRAEFTDMLSSKFGEEKLDKLFAAAEEAEPSKEVELAVVESGVSAAKKTKTDTSLRDSLKAKLEAASLRKPASVAQAKSDMTSIPIANEKLQPAGLDPWIAGEKEEQETLFTIFDIMHQKLEELCRREKI